MRLITWKDRITDTSNPWLNGTRTDDEGNPAQASVFYLRDAEESLTNGLPVRAALSCSCAANCLERTGNIDAARDLHIEAGKLYEEGAKRAFGRSIREAVWLLHRAVDCFVQGGDKETANSVYDECISLESRVNPFAAQSGGDGGETPGAARPRLTIGGGQQRVIQSRNPTMNPPIEVRQAVDSFLLQRRMTAQGDKPAKDAAMQNKKKRKNASTNKNEEIRSDVGSDAFPSSFQEAPPDEKSIIG